MTDQPDPNCPLCRNGLNQPPAESARHRGFMRFDCPNCGVFELAETIRDLTDDVGPKVSHYVRWRRDVPKLTSADVERIAEAELPSIHTQADNLVRFLAERHRPGVAVAIDPSTHQAAMGSGNPEAGLIVVNYLSNRGWFEPAYESGLWSDDEGCWGAYGRLSADGYARYEKIRRGRAASDTAFMAMEFGDRFLDRMYTDHFKGAVEQAGFELLRVDERPEPGLIDSQIELCIRRAKFVIADLTNQNHGAYWEAGLAEGLGKRVIYTCEKRYFDKHRTHFDTNHRQTVFWSEDTIVEDMSRLKGIVRVAFPDEAKLEDDA